MGSKEELLARLAGAWTGGNALTIYRYPPPELKAEKDLALAALSKAACSGYARQILREAPPELLADEQFWLKALLRNADFLEHAPDELLADPELVAAAKGGAARAARGGDGRACIRHLPRGVAGAQGREGPRAGGAQGVGSLGAADLLWPTTSSG